MRESTRRVRALGALTALLGGVGLAALPVTSASAAPVVDNACYNSVTAQALPITGDLSGTIPATLTPGQTFQSTGMSMQVSLPADLFLAGYSLGFIQNGQMLSGTIAATIAASNTVEGQQVTNNVAAQIGPINISDPDGTPGTGDETAADVSATVNFNDMTWTAGNGGQVALREASVPITNAAAGSPGGIRVDANMGFAVRFRCSPGTLDAAGAPVWGTAGAFATSNIQVAESAPVATDDTASVGATQSTSINVLANDSDVNGNIDRGSVTIASEPTSGTATVNADGTITYTNTAAANADSFTYTVSDTAGNVSNAATVNVSILSGACDASAASCSLDQVVEVQVNGASMSMEQAGSLIQLPAVTLNGQPQTTRGTLNGLTVVNARGTDAGWSLTGQMTTDLSDGTGVTACPAGDPSTWDNHCIPGGNVGWGPSASVAHDQIPGDVATVDAGPVLAQGGLDQAQSLCSAPAKRSGGTFECGGAIGVGIPASAAAGLYRGTLTLTLV